MKRTALFFLFFGFLSFSSQAQIEFNIKGGLHSVDLADEVVNKDGSMLSFNDSKYGYHFGLGTRLSLIGLFVEPSLIFNSSAVNYTLNDATLNNITTETYNDVSLPVVVGIGSRLFNVHAGPVAHFQIDGLGDIFRFSEYGDKADGATFGFQAGVGVKLWKLRADLRYEGNLSKYGENVEISDHTYNFHKKASRINLTVSYIL